MPWRASQVLSRIARGSPRSRPAPTAPALQPGRFAGGPSGGPAADRSSVRTASDSPARPGRRPRGGRRRARGRRGQTGRSGCCRADHGGTAPPPQVNDRSSGTKTSDPAMSWLPLPRSPPTYQVSRIVHSDAGKIMIRVTGAPLASCRGVSPSWMPLDHCRGIGTERLSHRVPLSRLCARSSSLSLRFILHRCHFPEAARGVSDHEPRPEQGSDSTISALPPFRIGKGPYAAP